MFTLLIIVFLMLGLFVGSFLNVVIARWPHEQFIFGRSHCMSCNHKLEWFDMIPVFSYIFLGGKCRYCKEHISWQYPIIEFITGLLFALGFWFIWQIFLPSGLLLFLVVMLYYMMAVSMLILMSAYDAKTFTIPNKFTVFAIPAALFFDFILIFFKQPQIDSNAFYWFSFPSFSFLSSIEGAAAGVLFMIALYFITVTKSLGFGDVKLILFLGLLVAWPGILLTIFIAFVLGAIVGILLIILKLKHLRSRLPFAPFLAVGAILTMFLYNMVFYGYFKGFF